MSARAVRIAAGYVEIGARTSKLQGALGRLQSKLNGIARRFARIGVGMSIFGGALVAFFAPFIRDAAIATEILNKFNQTFKGMNEEAEKFAQTFAGKLNRSITEVRESMAQFGAFFKGMEFSDSQMLAMTKALIKATADFASFDNLSDSEALQRMQSMLAGSSEVMDRFGVNTREAALDQEFLRQGLNVTTRTASEQQKVVARLNIKLRALNTKNASGDALRTMNTLMGSTRQFSGMLRNLREDIGKALEEPARKFILVLVPLLKNLSEWSKKNRTLLKSITVLGAVFVGVAGGALALAVAFKTLSFAMSALYLVKFAALLAPIAVPLVAITALLGTGAAAWYEYSETGKKAFEELGNVIGTLTVMWGEAFGAMQTALNAGDFQLAMEILTLALKQTWTEFFAWLSDAWYKVSLDIWTNVPGVSRLLGIDYKKEIENLEKIAEQRKENNRIQMESLKFQAEQKKKAAEEKKAGEQFEMFDIEGAAGAGGKKGSKSGRGLGKSYGTMSGFIANRMGFRGTKEGEKNRTFRTEQTPAEKKAQAEAYEKAIKNGEIGASIKQNANANQAVLNLMEGWATV